MVSLFFSGRFSRYWIFWNSKLARWVLHKFRRSYCSWISCLLTSLSHSKISLFGVSTVVLIYDFKSSWNVRFCLFPEILSFKFSFLIMLLILRSQREIWALQKGLFWGQREFTKTLIGHMKEFPYLLVQVVFTTIVIIWTILTWMLLNVYFFFYLIFNLRNFNIESTDSSHCISNIE